jgi:hypothetical protein
MCYDRRRAEACVVFVCIYYCSTYYKAVLVGDSGGHVYLCVFITAVPITKLFVWGEAEDSGGHVLRETTSRGLSGLV